jgi:hypothetical protein
LCVESSSSRRNSGIRWDAKWDFSCGYSKWDASLWNSRKDSNSIFGIARIYSWFSRINA